jgi:hypothetical protein
MATAAKTIDTKIINYLKVLNNKEKKAVLTVAEIFAKEHQEESESRLTKAQKAELDITFAEHKAGKLKYYTLEQAKKIIYGKERK